MARIVYVEPDGTEKSVAVKTGVSLMQGALSGGVRGIEAQCGGNCMCGTCHVYVEPSQLGLLPPPSDDEAAMLDSTAAPNLANSRLSCQIRSADRLDGLVLRLPPRQS